MIVLDADAETHHAEMNGRYFPSHSMKSTLAGRNPREKYHLNHSPGTDEKPLGWVVMSMIQPGSGVGSGINWGSGPGPEK